MWIKALIQRLEDCLQLEKSRNLSRCEHRALPSDMKWRPIKNSMQAPPHFVALRHMGEQVGLLLRMVNSLNYLPQ